MCETVFRRGVGDLQKTVTTDLKTNYDAEINNSVVEKIKRESRTSKMRIQSCTI